MEKVIILYHKNCNDGLGSGSAVKLVYPNALEFAIPPQCSDSTMEQVLLEINDKTKVISVDVVPSYNFVKKILKLTTDFMIIDHHVSNEEMFKSLEKKGVKIIYDEKYCGSYLTWNYFHGCVPEIVKYIDDKDLWKNKLGVESEIIYDFLEMYHNYNLTKFINEVINVDVNVLIENNRNLIDKRDEMINRFIKKTSPNKILINNFNVYLYNSSEFKSHLGNILTVHHGSPIGIYSISGGEVYISFRTIDEIQLSALECAKKFKGGGHRNAAACIIKWEEFKELF